jgi:hypothetical protein
MSRDFWKSRRAHAAKLIEQFRCAAVDQPIEIDVPPGPAARHPLPCQIERGRRENQDRLCCRGRRRRQERLREIDEIGPRRSVSVAQHDGERGLLAHCQIVSEVARQPAPEDFFSMHGNRRFRHSGRIIADTGS